MPPHPHGSNQVLFAAPFLDIVLQGMLVKRSRLKKGTEVHCSVTWLLNLTQIIGQNQVHAHNLVEHSPSRARRVLLITFGLVLLDTQVRCDGQLRSSGAVKLQLLLALLCTNQAQQH
jgi:hypothetical protein